MDRCQRTEWITSGIIGISIILVYLLIPNSNITGTGLDLILALINLCAILGLAIAFIIRAVKDLRSKEENKILLALRFILPICIYALEAWLEGLYVKSFALYMLTVLIVLLCNALFVLYYGHSRIMWFTLVLYNVSSMLYFLICPKKSLILLFPSKYYVELLLLAIAVGYTEYFVRVKKGLISAPAKAPRTVKVREKKSTGKSMEKSFSVCSVEAVSACQETDCVIVTGHVKGTVSAGIEVRVMNFGDDGCEEYPARILSLEIGRSSVPSATDCEVGIKLTGISMDKISEGCVISAGKATSEYLLWAFAMGLAYEYVERRDMDLTEEEWEMLPIGHLAEIASVYMAKIVKLPDYFRTDEFLKASKMKTDRLFSVLIRRVLAADELYVICSKRTGEPFMFTEVLLDDKDDYRVTPPNITLVTKGHMNILNSINDDMEMKLIKNSEDNGKAIYHLLGRAFYLNGACAVGINASGSKIMKDKIVSEPDYNDTPKASIPVTDPDLMRWLLLLGQMHDIKNDTDKAKIYGVLVSFALRELPKATFLVPMKRNSEFPRPDENGKIVIPAGAKMSFAVSPGKDGRDSICMFTDWYRLRQAFDESWDGMVVKIGDLIERHDCSINPTDHPAAGMYVSRDVYQKAVSMNSK